MLPLLPSGVGRLPTIPLLACPRRAETRVPVRNTGKFVDFYHPADILWTGCEDGSKDVLAAIDKAFPHATHDLMMIVANDDIRSGVGDVDLVTLRHVLKAARLFAEYIQKDEVLRRHELQGSTISIGHNYDPHTLDRDNGQWWDKRMHWHFNCWSRKDLEGAQVVELSRVTNQVIRRSLVDPVTYLASEILYQAADVSSFPVEMLCPSIESDIRHLLPLGLKIRIPNWDFLDTLECALMVRYLHDTVVRLYGQLRFSFTGTSKPSLPWQRPKLLGRKLVATQLDDISWLSETTKRRLLTLHRGLKPVRETEMLELRSGERDAVRHLTLAGVDYHLGFYWRLPDSSAPGAPDGKSMAPCLYMQFKLFSRLGSCPAVGGAVAANMDRKSGRVMSTEQLALRRTFQRGFLDLVAAERPALDYHSSG